MAKKPALNVWLYQDELAEFEKIASTNRHSNAATLKYMLEDYVSGVIKIDTSEKVDKGNRKMVSAQVDEDFKNEVLEKMKDDGLSMPELVTKILKAKKKI